MNKKSQGVSGEKMAEWFFNVNDWRMFRTQPETKTVYIKKKPTVIHCGSGGIADYTGYKMVDDRPLYVACEVKEAKGDSMPCSRLGKKQRDWLLLLPNGCAFVGVFWIDFCDFCMYHFKEKGSYKYNKEEK